MGCAEANGEQAVAKRSKKTEQLRMGSALRLQSVGRLTQTETKVVSAVFRPRQVREIERVVVELSRGAPKDARVTMCSCAREDRVG